MWYIVIKFKFYSIGVFLDFKKEKISYQVLNWHLPENQEKEFRNRLNLLSEELVRQR